jgi:hypothetical protein
MTVTPGTLWVLNPVFEAVTVYVSGASEMKPKCPVESVVVVAACDGEVAETAASAIGALLVASTALPVMPPVVPAKLGLAAVMRQTAAVKATAIRFNDIEQLLTNVKTASWLRVY